MLGSQAVIVQQGTHAAVTHKLATCIRWSLQLPVTYRRHGCRRGPYLPVRRFPGSCRVDPLRRQPLRQFRDSHRRDLDPGGDLPKLLAPSSYSWRSCSVEVCGVITSRFNFPFKRWRFRMVKMTSLLLKLEWVDSSNVSQQINFFSIQEQVNTLLNGFVLVICLRLQVERLNGSNQGILNGPARRSSSRSLRSSWLCWPRAMTSWTNSDKPVFSLSAGGGIFQVCTCVHGYLPY